jgi:hypothetical protein
MRDHQRLLSAAAPEQKICPALLWELELYLP